MRPLSIVSELGRSTHDLATPLVSRVSSSNPAVNSRGLRASGAGSLCCLVLLSLIVVISSHADTLALRTERVRTAARSIWIADFATAEDSGKAFIAAEPSSPIGYFILATTYCSICNQFNTDVYAERGYAYLDTTMDLCQVMIERDSANPDWYFVMGSAYGFRALQKGVHRSWIGVLKDANQAMSHLQKSLHLDSTYTDAWYGIGAGHYWKSARMKFLTWLPFISDRRKQGIREILIAGRTGYLSPEAAMKSLLSAYINMKHWDDVVQLGDSLHAAIPRDAAPPLYGTEALIELGRFAEAADRLAILRELWRSSQYFDSCGALEINYLSARIKFGLKDKEGAMRELMPILTVEHACKDNAYYRETLQKARGLFARIR